VNGRNSSPLSCCNVDRALVVDSSDNVSSGQAIPEASLIESAIVHASHARRSAALRRVLAAILTLVLTCSARAARAADEAVEPRPAAAMQREWIAYGGRMSSEATWQKIITGPGNAEWTDAWLAVAGIIDHTSWNFLGFEWEREVNVARYFGDQDHWEFNVAPLVARWTRMPFRDRVRSSVAFGLGLSYATQVPPVEVELEETSERLLVFWMMELALSPPEADWAVSLRIHHRSGAFGLVAEAGGMNAVTLGLRRRF
jgi:hypothetical protein